MEDNIFTTIASIKDRKALTKVIRMGNSSLEQRDPQGRTPLMCACASENIDAVEVLLEAGVLVNAVTAQNQTALHFACGKRSAKVVYALLEHGADVNIKDKVLLHSPLHSAVLSGNVEAVKALLAKGADVSAVGKHGWTPLHRAAARGNLDICQLLVEAGASVHVQLDAAAGRNLGGATPRMLADTANKTNVVSYLQKLEKGGEDDIGSSSNNSGGGKEQTAQQLLQKIVALKAGQTNSAPSPHEVRLRAAQGHLRARSVAVGKEEDLTSSQPPPPTTTQQQQQQQLVTSSSSSSSSAPSSDPSLALSSSGNVPEISPALVSSLPIPTSVLSSLSADSPLLQRPVPKIFDRKSHPVAQQRAAAAAAAAQDASMSGPSPVPTLNYAGMEEKQPANVKRSRPASPAAREKEFDEMLKTLQLNERKIVALTSRVKFLEWVFMVFAVLLLVSLALK